MDFIKVPIKMVYSFPKKSPRLFVDVVKYLGLYLQFGERPPESALMDAMGTEKHLRLIEELALPWMDCVGEVIKEADSRKERNRRYNEKKRMERRGGDVSRFPMDDSCDVSKSSLRPPRGDKIRVEESRVDESVTSHASHALADALDGLRATGKFPALSLEGLASVARGVEGLLADRWKELAAEAACMPGPVVSSPLVWIRKKLGALDAGNTQGGGGDGWVRPKRPTRTEDMP
jgi:hypothetical protein